MTQLSLVDVPISGSIPSTWGSTCMPALQNLTVMDTLLSGSLPTEWGNASSFQRLEFLEIYNCNFSGA